MNKDFKTVTIVLLSLCLCACEGDGDELPGSQQGTVPIGFTPDVETQTRGEELTSANLPSFGVFAYFTQGGDFDETTSTPNYLYDERVYKAGGTGDWTYENTRYWPANSTDKLSFFAYAPAYGDIATTGNAIGVPGSTQAGYPQFTYTNTNAQTDLLTAVPALNLNTPDAKVSFKFKHTLTKIAFKVKSYYDLTVNSFSIKGKSSGKLTFNSSGVTWSDFGSEKDYSYTGSASITANSEAAGIVTLFMLPQYTGTFSISYTLDGKVITKNNLSLPPGTWEKGQSTAYLLSIDKIGLSISVENMPWMNGGDKNLHETEMGTSSGNIPWTEGESKNIDCTTT